MTQAVRIAIVGAGHLGTIHARLLAELPDAEIVGVVDPSSDARQRIAAQHSLEVFDDVDAILPRCDAVVIAAPTPLHESLGRRCLDAGLHVLMEKPLCSTLEECQELIRLAQDCQRILQVGHVERFNPAFVSLQTQIEQPRYIESQRRSSYPQRSTETSVVLDLMIHDIDLVLNLVSSDLLRVQAWGQSLIGAPIDAAQARLEFRCGCIANLSASRVSPNAERSLTVWDDRHQWHADLQERSVARIAAASQNMHVQPLPVATTNPLQEEQRDFLAAIQQQRAPQVSGEAGRDAVNVAERIHESIARQQTLIAAENIPPRIRRAG